MSAFQKDSLGFLKQLAASGDIARFRLGPFRAYLINNPDLIQQILVKEPLKFHKSLLAKIGGRKFLGDGLILSEDGFWQKQRKLMQPAFHYSRLQSYAQAMVNAADRLMSEWGASQTLDVEEAMLKVTLNIVNKTLFDADVNEEARRVYDAMQLFQEVLGAEVKSPSFFPDWVPTRHNQNRRQALTVLDDIVMGIINERKQSNEDRGDLLSMLLLARYDDGSPMSDQQIRNEAVTLFVAGHETTGLTLAWALYLISQHPEVEARLLDELRPLNNQPPGADDLVRLPYTEMVIKETMRLYPPAWQVSRSVVEPVQIGNRSFRKGDILFLSPYITQRDPRWWEQPDQFIPERFAPGNEERLPRYAYFPFGGGPRICIGNTFAMMEARLVLARLFQRYQFRLSPGQVIEPQALVTLRAKNGLKLAATLRQGWIIKTDTGEFTPVPGKSVSAK
jgi:cytochrome P450